MSLFRCDRTQLLPTLYREDILYFPSVCNSRIQGLHKSLKYVLEVLLQSVTCLLIISFCVRQPLLNDTTNHFAVSSSTAL